MLTLKEVKAIAAHLELNCTIKITVSTFEYLHHDASAFERRCLPCFNITLTGKRLGWDDTGRRPGYRYQNTDDARWTLIHELRARGLCAEPLATTAHLAIINVPREQWPFNKVYGLGDWHEVVEAA